MAIKTSIKTRARQSKVAIACWKVNNIHDYVILYTAQTLNCIENSVICLLPVEVNSKSVKCFTITTQFLLYNKLTLPAVSISTVATA